MLRSFLNNHVFANLTFALVLVVGFLSYLLLPRQQDPDMNFNWISIITFLPGASAEEVEKRITDPLEEALQKVADVKFVLSGSRESTSDVLVRFTDIDDRTFDKRVSDLRREIRNKERELPEEAEDPMILEITSANGFPTAMVVVQGRADDENLRRQAHHVKTDLEQIKGVDKVAPLALRDPELQIHFSPARLNALGITPMVISDTLSSRFRDVSAGSLRMGGKTRLLRLQGTTSDPKELARWPLIGTEGELLLGDVAQVSRGRKKAAQLVSYQGQPSVLFSITKRPNSNVIDLIERIDNYIKERKKIQDKTGVTVALADDQTHMVQNALGVMEKNALLGLFLVMITSWLFLGSRIALLIGFGIPFTLAGTFALLYSNDHSLNVMVLLGVVIALGMLVDDAVVVVESIFFRLQRGMNALDAGLDALKEVTAPVTTSVLTTMAAFLPLMLLPGILGKFMRVIPMVVTISLAISLVEAFWMLPAHVAGLKLSFSRSRGMHKRRTQFLRRLRLIYMRMLLTVFRWPKLSLLGATLPIFVAVGLVATGSVKVNFFAMDPIPLFYINIKMPTGTSLPHTLDKVVQIENRIRQQLIPGEARTVLSYAGQMFTETKPFFGDKYGQILVSLTPDNSAHRPIPDIIEKMRQAIVSIPGTENISFLEMSGGPPVTSPINVKVRGDDLTVIQSASEALKKVLLNIPEVSDITDDFSIGTPELILTPNDDAIRRAGLSPRSIVRLTRLMADGEVAARFQHQGEQVEVRVLADKTNIQKVEDLLNISVPLPKGGSTPLKNLVNSEAKNGLDTIRHFNFRRAITVSANLDLDKMDVVTANNHLKEAWKTLHTQFPGVNLDFSGILDDINEAMDAIGVLFLFGVGLMYMILGTQFRSYFQPFMILTTVPMAFTGVIFGTMISGQSLSLYTLYGVVALSGIAVNSSIVLISAANSRRNSGMRTFFAIFYAARRRLIPIIITTVTTIAGLFSLAVGLGGHSLLWGPIATAIVWGLAFSTILTLFLVPLLYLVFMSRKPA